MIQPDLFTSPAPVVSASQVEQLIDMLELKGWQTATALVSLAGHKGIEFDDRKVRAMASTSGGRIISGQKGYCLIEEATVAEVQHFIAWMRSQAKSMEQRAYDTERALHQRHRTEAA